MIFEWSPFRSYGGKRRIFCLPDWLALAFLLAMACLLHAAGSGQGKWNWNACATFFITHNAQGEWQAGLLLQGLFTTLRVGFWTFAFSLFLGSLLGFWAADRNSWASLPYQFLINLLRNCPPLVLLFCVYFIVGNLLPIAFLEDALRNLPNFVQDFIHHVFVPSGQLDKMLSAVLALGLYQAAYIAEIARGALESVPAGQWDAGYALGFSRGQVLLHIILPQGMRLGLPALTGQCISTFKESALASLISLPDLTFESLEIMATTLLTFEVWICAAFLYLMIGICCALPGWLLERHFSRTLY